MSEEKPLKQLYVTDIQEMKNRGEKFIVAPVWDYNTTQIAEEAGAEVVGLGGATGTMMIGGQKNSLKATMEEVLFLTRIAAPAIRRAVLFTALPYGSFQVSNEEAVRNAIQIMKAGAHCVKMQAPGPLKERIRQVVIAGIPAMGHVGLLPQYIHKNGGYRIVGKTCEQAKALYRECRELEELGVWAIEMECVPHKIAAEIAKRIKVPILGVGSGSGCDGQSMMLVDMWGLQKVISNKFSKKYLDLWPMLVDSLKEYIDDVKTCRFPDEEHSYGIKEEEYEGFMEFLDKE